MRSKRDSAEMHTATVQSAAAAGVKESHTMALLEQLDTSVSTLDIRLPAVVQVWPCSQINVYAYAN